MEEYLAAKIWPSPPSWLPTGARQVKFVFSDFEIHCPFLGLKRPEGKSDEVIVEDLKRAASELIGPWNRKEYDFFVAVSCHEGRINRCLYEMEVRYEVRTVPLLPQKRFRTHGNIGLEFPATKKSRKSAGAESGGTSAQNVHSKPAKQQTAKHSLSQVDA